MLIKCKECGGDVSDRANACPHCGAPVGYNINPIGKISRWIKAISQRIEDQRVKRAEARRVEFERQKKEEERRYASSFSFSSMPYEDPTCASMNYVAIRKALVAACSSSEVMSVLASFPTARDGYITNLPWFKEYIRLHRASVGEFVGILFVAYMFNDFTFCDELIRPGHVLSTEYAGSAFRKFCKHGYGETEQLFLRRYVPMDTESIKEYAKKMKWLPLIEAHDFDSINFYKDLGISVKIGDEGLNYYRHRDYSHWYTYEYASPLSKALDEDNIERLRFLLNWGANPNQYLYWSRGRSEDSVPVRASPLLYKIKSVEAYKLMKAGGMEDYPIPNDNEPNECCNLVEHLWCGEALAGKQLELLDYLYEIGYDKPIVARLFIIKKALDNGNYKNNITIVREWLQRKSNV